MFRLEGSDFFSGARKLGDVRGEVFDAHGALAGSFRGRAIFDKSGRVVGSIRGNGVYDQGGSRITTVTEIRKALRFQGETSIVALWLLLVNHKS